MSNKDDEIKALKQLLKKAEEKAARAEEKLEKERDRRRKAEADRKRAEEFIVVMTALIPVMKALSDQCQEILQQLPPDLPQADVKRLLNVMQETQADFINLSKYHTIVRLFAKGSEKIGRPKKTDDFEAARNALDKAVRNLKKRQQELQALMKASSEAAKEAYAEQPDNEALKAAADIAETPEPEVREFEHLPSPGRQLLEAKQKGDFDSDEPLEIPGECPHCGHSNLITGAEIKSTLRHFETSINKLSQLIQLKSQHCYCQTCGQAFCVCGRDVPVKPGREMGQSVVVAAAELNAVGIPLNKVMQLLFMKDDQLGKDTLGRNLHDWLLDTGKPLMDSVLAELNTQHTMLMDETALPVLQSNGQGVCEAPESEKRRQKDYIGVQCSAPGVDRQCVRYIYLGSRDNESIFAALQNARPSVLVTDGYVSYASYCKGLERPTPQCCLVHLRRLILDALAIPKMNKELFGDEVDKAVEKAKSHFTKGTSAFLLCSVLSAFSKIYGNEASLIQKDGESREEFLARVKKSRQSYAKPLMKNIDTILCELAKKETQTNSAGVFESADKTKQIGATVAYYMNRRDSFHVFLEDPEVPTDSNAVERAIRPLTVLRKATDFKQSRDRTESLCILMSLYETAKANNIHDIPAWLLACGRAYYLYRANRTLTRRMQEGLKAGLNKDELLDARITSFTDDAGDGFDWTPYLPWNFKQ